MKCRDYCGGGCLKDRGNFVVTIVGLAVFVLSVRTPMASNEDQCPPEGRT